MNKIKDAGLIDKAVEAARDAYAPYSGLKVGAALETEDGSVYTGANVENASYGLSICAERVAVFKAVTDGKTRFKRMAVATDSGAEIVPCGACLQVLSEFGSDMLVLANNPDGDIISKHITDLLPAPFRQTR